MAPARPRRWANISKPICAGCSVLLASPTSNSFPPMASESDRNTARKRWQAPCKLQPTCKRRDNKCDTACRARTATGGSPMSDAAETGLGPDAGYAEDNRGQRHQQTYSGEQRDRDERVAFGFLR